jgi:hypothetical protein
MERDVQLAQRIRGRKKLKIIFLLGDLKNS